jgi:hypothetical protein
MCVTRGGGSNSSAARMSRLARRERRRLLHAALGAPERDEVLQLVLDVPESVPG